ncbi:MULTISPECIES: isocitrate lyase/PEP mutase family protein [Chromobacterium]|uniref:Oxaloacetate decarboxylase n=1 Tax=Chromobacterium rhizoryzae TaxID=1778675 RepID=A0AAD0RUN7_9NEIS|nr:MULTISPECIES: oxaloacetate decarboxylase [Chromobacterium]AXT48449.1 oxaloacetate decarboxylase [Chromobacterium rhizoryzae]MDH0341789.1 oxaloacetate decarboxylase [Chromobacterium haemolyticum]PTU69702.1 carboxyvinyl-carboxyphosphonate phosphorylmutase [Chromobacterium haemolyticum]QOD82417.1 oxaloacetate decarboxylase [Chromobacterium haemolyticum]BBH15038.1 carboxyvinyl-carboxyphosphonate phosphorylmutase [Chromobacterium haemolyticum]
MTQNSKHVLRSLIASRSGLLVPGAYNALSARIVEDLGFGALYLTGAGLTNMQLGLPDLGFVGLKEVADQVSAIRDAVSIPIIVDADTGFGNALNVRRTVRVLERAGADAIQLEDQVLPKKCGHFAGQNLISAAEMCGKLQAAAEARQDENLLIIARTDACAVDGIDAAIERAGRYAEAGADVLFIEAVRELDDIRRLPALFDRPLLMNIVIGGKTPALSAADLKELGYGLVLYANAALQGAVLGMQRALGALSRDGILQEDPQLVTPFAERQRLVNKPLYDELDARYGAAGRD